MHPLHWLCSLQKGLDILVAVSVSECCSQMSYTFNANVSWTTNRKIRILKKLFFISIIFKFLSVSTFHFLLNVNFKKKSESKIRWNQNKTKQNQSKMKSNKSFDPAERCHYQHALRTARKFWGVVFTTPLLEESRRWWIPGFHRGRKITLLKERWRCTLNKVLNSKKRSTFLRERLFWISLEYPISRQTFA